MRFTRKLERLQVEQKAIAAELALYEKRFQGKLPLPKIWALDGKIGARSIQMSGNKLVFGNAEADPSAAGDLQRNAANMKFQ